MNKQTSILTEKLIPIRRGEIEGKQILVFDGLVEEEERANLTTMLDDCSFTRKEADRADTADFTRTWKGEIDEGVARHLPLFEPSLTALRQNVPAARYKLHRAYCNVTLYGDMLFIHEDVDGLTEELDYYTALWFVCQEWETEWGGETLFFSRAGDAEFVVSPKPCRLALFDGTVPHVGRPPTRICYKNRYTLALKFIVEGSKK